MKVLIVSQGDFYGGGRTALMIEALLEAGHEIERVKLEDMPIGGQEFIALGYDEFAPMRKFVNYHIDKLRTDEVKRIKSNPGVRNRWGQVK